MKKISVYFIDLTIREFDLDDKSADLLVRELKQCSTDEFLCFADGQEFMNLANIIRITIVPKE